MLPGRLHLAECLLMAGGHEERIVAEAVAAPRRPGDGAVDPALEPFAMAVGPAQGQGADEMGVAARFRAEPLELVMDSLHRQVEVALAGHLAGAGFGRQA